MIIDIILISKKSFLHDTINARREKSHFFYIMRKRKKSDILSRCFSSSQINIFIYTRLLLLFSRSDSIHFNIFQSTTKNP
nr:MAG TPA: hypothetical protein [Caudoviricetes sp.]